MDGEKNVLLLEYFIFYDDKMKTVDSMLYS